MTPHTEIPRAAGLCVPFTLRFWQARVRGRATGGVSIRVAELFPGGDGVGGLPRAVDTAAKVRHTQPKKNVSSLVAGCSTPRGTARRAYVFYVVSLFYSPHFVSSHPLLIRSLAMGICSVRGRKCTTSLQPLPLANCPSLVSTVPPVSAVQVINSVSVQYGILDAVA